MKTRLLDLVRREVPLESSLQWDCRQATGRMSRGLEGVSVDAGCNFGSVSRLLEGKPKGRQLTAEAPS